MPMSLPSFLSAWLLMMTAMMLPALIPVILLYQLATRRRTVAPLPVFVTGYLAVWVAAGLPAYLGWRALDAPLMDGAPWTGRLAGAALLAAAAYQLTPAKVTCLRRCRSPVSALGAVRGNLSRPTVALRAGARNGLWCLGCCWSLMAVLVTVGVMQPWWMAVLALMVFAEKALPSGQALSRPLAALLGGAGLALLLSPQLLVHIAA